MEMCCRGIPAYVPLNMEPSHTTTTKRSRLSLQPGCPGLPVSTVVHGNRNEDPIHDTELDGMLRMGHYCVYLKH